MRRSLKAIAATLTITALLFSCKKNTDSPGEQSPIHSDAAKVEAWFTSQPKAAMAKMPAATALYNNTISYVSRGINITPMEMAGNANSKAGNAFLVTYTNAAGTITTGSIYLVLDKAKRPAAAIAALVTPGFLFFEQLPGDFTGAIIQYDLSGKVLASTTIEAGKFKDNQQDVVSDTKQAKTGDATPNMAPPPSGQTCTDWYWQHFENGILIWEQYLFTTCEDGTTGGGGSSNANAQCIQSAEDFVNQGSATSQLVSGGTELETRFQKIDDYNWKIYSAGTWGIISWERVTWTRSAPNLAWTYSNYTSLGDSEVGASIGGTRTYKIISKTPTSFISSVLITINFTVTHQAVCSGISVVIPPVTVPYNANYRCIPRNVTVTAS